MEWAAISGLILLGAVGCGITKPRTSAHDGGSLSDAIDAAGLPAEDAGPDMVTSGADAGGDAGLDVADTPDSSDDAVADGPDTADVPLDAPGDLPPDDRSDLVVDAVQDVDAIAGPSTIKTPIRGTVCSYDGWCWMNPSPQGNDLNAAWASAPNDVWTASESGIQHWDGEKWSLAPGTEATRVYGIWGKGPSDIWAVGWWDVFNDHPLEAILHWDGTSWSRSLRDTGTGMGWPLSIWGFADDDIWVVGDSAIARHWNGLSWTEWPIDQTSILFAVWGNSPDDVWAVGDHAIVHWNGVAWSQPVAPDDRIRAVWGTGRDDVWAGGDQTFWHWDGTAWSLVKQDASASVVALWGTTSKDIWAGAGSGLWHWDGNSWSHFGAGANAMDRVDQVTAVTGTGPRDVWAVGLSTLIAHWDGTTWEPIVPRRGEEWLQGIWGSADDDIWAVGTGGTILRWDGQSWRRWDSHTLQSLSGVWGSGATDVWTVGAAGSALHWNGRVWTSVDTGTMEGLSSIWGSGADDVWAIGGHATILHFDGHVWSRVTPALVPADWTFFALAGADATHVWFLGAERDFYVTHIVRFDGTTWSLVPNPSSAVTSFRALYASGPGDLWASGGKETGVLLEGTGYVYRFDGATWTQMLYDGPSTPARYFLGWSVIWGRGPNDIWIGSTFYSMLQHWDGSTWSVSRNGNPGTGEATTGMMGIWGSPSGALWTVGRFEAILRRR